MQRGSDEGRQTVSRTMQPDPAKEGLGLTREMQRGVGLCSGARTRVVIKGARTMQSVRLRGGTGNDSTVAVEF